MFNRIKNLVSAGIADGVRQVQDAYNSHQSKDPFSQPIETEKPAEVKKAQKTSRYSTENAAHYFEKMTEVIENGVGGTMLYELPSFSTFPAAQDFIKAKATMAADPRIDTDFNFCLGRLEELYEPKLKGLLESALKAKHCIFFEDDFFTLAKPTPNLINSNHYMHLLNSLSVLVWEQFTQNKFADAVNLLVGSMYLIMGLSYNSTLRINAEYAGFGGSAIMQKCYNFALEEIEPKYFEYLYRYLSYLPSPVVNANFVVQKQRQIMLKAFENIEKDQKAIAHLFAYNEEAHHMGTTAKDAYDYHRSPDFQRDKDILIKYYDALVKVDLYGDDAYGIIMDLKHEEGRNELSEYFALNPNYILNFVQRTERLSGARDRTMEILSNYYQ